MPSQATTDSRFWAKVNKNGPLWNGTHCWLWTAATQRGGYGHFYLGGGRENARYIGAHRYAYEALVGPIPEGLEPDHLCRTPLCVRPWHLEPVTSRVNHRRSHSPAGNNSRKTHCPQGHEYAGSNIIRDRNGNRKCRVCFRARMRVKQDAAYWRAWREKRKSGRAASASASSRSKR